MIALQIEDSNLEKLKSLAHEFEGKAHIHREFGEGYIVCETSQKSEIESIAQDKGIRLEKKKISELEPDKDLFQNLIRKMKQENSSPNT